MKRYIIKTIALALSVCAVLTGCEKTYEFSHGVGMISSYNVLGIDAGSTPVLIFSNTTWTAAFDQNVDWAYIDRTEGEGDGELKFHYQQNYGRSRAVTIVVTGGGETATLRMWQKAAIGDDAVVMQLAEMSGDAPAAAASYDVALTTNLVYQVKDFQYEAVDSEDQPVNWISDVTVTDDPQRKGNCTLSFTLSKNSSGEDRSAKIRVTHVDGGGAYDSTVGTVLKSNDLVITQKHE